jgi:hypothetical protein
LKPEDLKAFTVELQALAKGYYDKELQAETIIWYFEDLQHHTLDRVRHALRLHVRTPRRCNFFPKPGDLEELLAASGVERSSEAWVAVDRSIRHYGRYVSVQFNDGLIADVIEQMGGWVAVCSAETERDLLAKKADFCRRYEGACLRGQVPRADSKVVGLIDQARGHALERPPEARPLLLSMGQGGNELTVKVVQEGR